MNVHAMSKQIFSLLWKTANKCLHVVAILNVAEDKSAIIFRPDLICTSLCRYKCEIKLGPKSY